MSKIAEIENTLSQMNPARFKELGDIFLLLEFIQMQQSLYV